MNKEKILSTVKFTIFTILCLLIIFSAVLFSILNIYKPAVKTYIDGEFVGYFSSEQQFDSVYNDLVTEKQQIDPNVKVYLESEPVFDEGYIKSSLFEEQNLYTNLRAKIKTEFTVYNVAVNDEIKMTFNTQDEANKYSEELKKDVANINVEVNLEKVSELGELTTIERAESILQEIVDRNKPVEVPEVVLSPDEAFKQGGVWPTVSHYISSYYGWRWGTIHSGTDIAGRANDNIYAYKSGTVTFAGWNSYGYGNLVKIDHGNGYSTWYAHCNKLLVKSGQVVEEGQKIALMGSTGYSTGNHLHFEVRVNGVHRNSLPYIQ